MRKITLKKGEGRTIKAGGAWIFDNEIAEVEGFLQGPNGLWPADYVNGELVEVHDFDGYPMGTGFMNVNSKIRVRMMTRKPEQEINDEFLLMRVKNAWEYRKAVMQGGNTTPQQHTGNINRPDLNCCRIIFGEADFLPGLTIDKYADYLVVECLALGMEQFKVKIVKFLVEEMKKDGIDISLVYERSDAREREKEGLEKFKGVLWVSENAAFLKENYAEEKSGSVSKKVNSDVDINSITACIGQNEIGNEENSLVPHIHIVENGVKYEVDVVNGQKTGFFLDQKYNRKAIQRLCKGKKVLDCFTHMGTFALNAGLAGATDVLGLDISEFAVAQATQNAQLNNLSDTVKFRAANVLDELPKLYEAGESYDVVILDPPAFTKSKEATKNAIKGYREVNMKGLKLVRDGGYLATCSCSHFMTPELFTQMMHQAAQATHKRLRQVESRTQGPDHPILWNSAPGTENSNYLKFLIFQVVDEK